MRRKISQREAHRTAKQLRDLRKKFSGLTERYTSDWPGTPIGSLTVDRTVQLIVDTARALGAGVAVRINSNDKSTLNFYAVKP